MKISNLKSKKHLNTFFKYNRKFSIVKKIQKRGKSQIKNEASIFMQICLIENVENIFRSF